MNYVILDLEFNNAYSKRKHRFVNEIIEFGAVKTDGQLNIIDSFSSLVTPQISKRLNSHVKNLTHLTMDELKAENHPFTSVMSKFARFCSDSVLVTWGTGDVLALMDNCRYYYGKAKIPYLEKYLNLQEYCECALGCVDRSKQMGLGNCAEKLGIDFDQTVLHRASEDAMLSLECFKKLYQELLANEKTAVTDDDFYARLRFKNHPITDLRQVGSLKKEMFFFCGTCGKKAKRKSKFRLKNRSFRAVFRCPSCKKEFEGRVTFKQMYDHIEVQKRVYSLKKPELTPSENETTQENKQPVS